MEKTKTPMKDKETKEEFYRLFKIALNQAVSGEEMRDGEKDGLEELINYVSKLEQEAERRGRVEENKRCVKLIGEAIQATSWEAPQQFFDGLRCARSSIET